MTDSWAILAEQEVYRSWAHVVRRRYRLPDGAEDDFEVLVAPQVVVVLALTADGHAVLARQFRPGPGALLDELPGGTVEPGEDIAVAAARELREETGYAGDLAFVGRTFQAANSTMVKHVFTATNCVRVAEATPDPTEHIEPVLVTLGELRDRLREGSLTDQGPGYAALDSLGLL